MQSISFSFKGFSDALIESVSGKIAARLQDFSFSSFLLGISFPQNLSDDERALLRKEFQFALVKELEKKMKAKADFENPDVQITIDFNSRIIYFFVSSVFLYGIYKKLSRKLAQTIFYCLKCRGKGCKECKFKGRLGIHTVQELVAKPCMKAFNAAGNKFHGSGREDVDVRMLGNGREFVLELIEPKTRKADLMELQKKISQKPVWKKLLVQKLSFTTKKMVEELKQAKHEKIYEAVVACKNPVEKKHLKFLKKVFLVEQRTPDRVSARRADLVRKRRAKILLAKLLSKKSFSMKIQAEAGLYVKEFISGDEGRTLPSVSSLLENQCACRQLDVVKILR